MLVDLDAAGGADVQPGLPGQLGLGGHADGQHHRPGGDGAAGGEGDLVGLDGLQAVGDDELHSVVAQLLVEHLDHVVVKGGHDLVGGLHQGHVLAGVDQVFGHLQADEAAAHHGHVLYAVGVDITLDGGDIHHVADGEHLLAVGAGDGPGHDGAGPRGEDQHVIALGVGGAVGPVLHRHRLGRAVDGDHLGLHPHVDVVVALELLRIHHQQPLAAGHHAAEVVGQGAVGEGDVGAPLENGNAGALVQPPHPGGRRGSAGHAADH